MDMKRYIALLRGINISGKNKVPMAELKSCFEKLAFEEIKTYLNSGNVIFSSDADDTKKITDQIERIIKKSYSGLLAVKIIKKQIGGLRQQVQISALS